MPAGVRSLRFADLVRGQSFDEAAFRRNLHAIAPASRAYIILFSARSGSSWLTEALSATGVLGTPNEFLNPDFVVDLARAAHAGTASRLLQMLRRQQQTANGVFGMEARHLDIEALGLEPFRAVFADHAVFFHLWREDIVAQAVSLYRAVATERFHSTSAAGAAAPPPYDANQIARWLTHLADTENGNQRLLGTLGVSARTITYEAMVADQAGTVLRIAEAVGVALPPAVAASGATLEKIGDAWNTAAAARFRADHASLVDQVAARRLVVHGATPAAPAAAAPVRAAAADLPDELPDAVLKFRGARPPRPLPELTARLLGDVLADQERRSVPGEMLEIGLSRGRQTALLLRAAQRTGGRLVGIDGTDGGLSAALRAAMQDGGGAARWTTRIGVPGKDQAEWLAVALGAPARLVCVDAASFTCAPDELIRLGAGVLGGDGCLAVSDFLVSSSLAVTEAVFRVLAASNALAPFALLPGRLLLAPAAAAPRYHDMIKAFALREAARTGAGRLGAALRNGKLNRLVQTLAGWPVLVLG